MACRSLKLSIAMLLFLCGATTAPSSDTTEYTDKIGAFTIKADSDWKRMPDVESLRVATDLCLRYVGKTDGKLHGDFEAVVVSAKRPIDKEASILVDNAKKKVPDQGDAGTVTTAKLDGEDARIVITRGLVKGQPVKRKMVMAIHNGKLFGVGFFCAEDEYSEQSATADKIIDSFHWK